MKKNSFMEGTIIATTGIILTKIIGIAYVIPFNAIIGEQGGALYGYAYTVYQLFLNISTAGFPFAISKITSEYNALGYNKAIKRTYKEATKIISIISILAFLLLFIFAPQIGKLIIGSSTGGNTYNDIAFVIRMVSFAILIIPFLSVTRGLLQGYKYITPYTFSQVIEQIIRVIVIIAGSYLCMKVFKLELKYAVGIAVLGAFFGGIFAYFYLKRKVKKSKILEMDANIEEREISNNEIFKKIIGYSIPFIAISIIYSLYNTIDMILLSRSMIDILKMDHSTIDSILSIYTTWGIKLNSIILAISSGLVTSLIPNIVSSYTKKNMKDVNLKFNQALQCILLIIVPITIYLSLLAKPVWTFFYGNSFYGPTVYKYFVYTALTGSIYTVIMNTLQGINKYKLVLSTVSIGLIINAILDVPLIILFNKLGYNPSYGAITGSIIGFSISIIVSLITLTKKHNFNINDTLKRLPSYILSWLVFITVVLLLKQIININYPNRLIQIPILAIFGILSFSIYLFINYKNKNLSNILDESMKNKLKIK